MAIILQKYEKGRTEEVRGEYGVVVPLFLKIILASTAIGIDILIYQMQDIAYQHCLLSKHDMWEVSKHDMWELAIVSCHPEIVSFPAR